MDRDGYAACSAWPPVVRCIVEPCQETTVSLCVSDSQPLSEPACAIREILLGLVGRPLGSARAVGIRPAVPQGAAASSAK